MIYKGNKGQYILNDSPFAYGGEGRIYEIKNYSQYVAKIYHPDKIDLEKEKKLQYMVNNPPRKDVLSQIAWPLDLIYNSSNQFIGFIMPKLKKSENLNAIYRYDEEAKYKNLPWSKKIQIAKNICAVLEAVHEAGHVVGDLNPKNIGVDPSTGFVTFFDADSFHITDSNGKIYRCKVGTPGYLPFELQQKMSDGLDKTPLPTFTMNTDNFALGIHIFQLLMNGVHPYAGRPLPTEESVVTPTPDKNILLGVMPFFQTNTNLDIPIMAPKLDALSNFVRRLFTLCFVNGHKDPGMRPTGETWFHALTELQKELTTCKSNSNHQFYNALTKCPWCDIDKRYNETLNVYAQNNQKPVPVPPVPQHKRTPKINNNQYRPTKIIKSEKLIKVSQILCFALPIVFFILGQIIQYFVYYNSGYILLMNLLSISNVHISLLIVSSILGLIYVILNCVFSYFVRNIYIFDKGNSNTFNFENYNYGSVWSLFLTSIVSLSFLIVPFISGFVFFVLLLTFLILKHFMLFSFDRYDLDTCLKVALYLIIVFSLLVGQVLLYTMYVRTGYAFLISFAYNNQVVSIIYLIFSSALILISALLLLFKLNNFLDYYTINLKNFGYNSLVIILTVYLISALVFPTVTPFILLIYIILSYVFRLNIKKISVLSISYGVLLIILSIIIGIL